MKHCAVIVAAYQAQPWIAECLHSVMNQAGLDGWTFSVRVGVDGCKETSHFLSNTLKFPHAFSPERVGPYLIRNSLIALERADAYAIFDADDVMEPAYLRTLAPLAMPNGVAGGMRRGMTVDGKPIASSARPFRVGVCVYSHEAITKLGGFHPWDFGADHDAIKRALALGIPITSDISGVLYRRRHHPGSLTADPEIGLGTERRHQLRFASAEMIGQGHTVADFTTTPLEHRS